jgi:hypothetical protein
VARRGEISTSFGKRAGRMPVMDSRGKRRVLARFLPPICILMVPHMPWVYKNIPILPGLHDELVNIIHDKIVSGAYEPSNAAYRSRWFCVIKQDGSSLHIIHDLCPFNAITIKDASIPPIMEQLVELFGAHACYASLNLFVT